MTILFDKAGAFKAWNLKDGDLIAWRLRVSTTLWRATLESGDKMTTVVGLSIERDKQYPQRAIYNIFVFGLYLEIGHVNV